MPPPLSAEPYADLYPSITFSLLSPVLEETTPHLLSKQLFSPPLPAPPPPPIAPPSLGVQDANREPTDEEMKREEEKFADIFKRFSFTTNKGPESGKRGIISNDLSPTMKELPTFPTPTRLPREQPKPIFIAPTVAPVKVPEPVQELVPRKKENRVVGTVDAYLSSGQVESCRKWVDKVEEARKEAVLEQVEEEGGDLVGNLVPTTTATQDPHPIYSRRRSNSSITRPLPPLSSTTAARHSIPSRSSSPTSSFGSRPNSMVIAANYTSPYSSLASTPETSPTSSNFNHSNKPSSALGSKPSSIRSTSSKFSNLSKKLSVVKFASVVTGGGGRKRSASESNTTRFQGFGLPNDVTPNQQQAPSPPPPVPSIPTLAQLFPPSAPTPSFLTGNDKYTSSRFSSGGGGEGKKKKRRDSMIGQWKDEQKKRELDEALERAYGKIERESGRKSFDV